MKLITGGVRKNQSSIFNVNQGVNGFVRVCERAKPICGEYDKLSIYEPGFEDLDTLKYDKLHLAQSGQINIEREHHTPFIVRKETQTNPNLIHRHLPLLHRER